MLKLFCCFAYLVCSASAATIIDAVSEQPFYQNSVDIEVEADVFPPPHQQSGFAFFFDDYTLTITGGTGQSSFVPCLFAGEVLVGSDAAEDASFGSDTISTPYGSVGNRTCSQPYDGFTGTLEGLKSVSPIPFTFGVPQVFTIELEAEAMGPPEGGGRAVLYGIQDYNGGILQNAQFTLVEVEFPEPATWWLLSAGLGALLMPRRFYSRLSR